MNNDLISREALKKQLNHLEMVTNNSSLIEQAEYKMLMTCISLIDNAPTVEIPCNQIIWEQGYECGKNERPQGEWAFDEKGFFCCDQCGKYPYDQYATTNFCPNCGADMRGDAE